MTDDPAATADAREVLPGTTWISIPVSTDLLEQLDKDALVQELGLRAAEAALALVGRGELNG